MVGGRRNHSIRDGGQKGGDIALTSSLPGLSMRGTWAGLLGRRERSKGAVERGLWGVRGGGQLEMALRQPRGHRDEECLPVILKTAFTWGSKNQYCPLQALRPRIGARVPQRGRWVRLRWGTVA